MQIISIWNNFTWSAKINTRRVLITQRPNRKIYMHMHTLVWWYFWAGGVGGFPLLAHHYLRWWLSCVMCGEESYNVRIARARRDNKHLLLRVARLPRRAAACCCCASPPPTHTYSAMQGGCVCAVCISACLSAHVFVVVIIVFVVQRYVMICMRLCGVGNGCTTADGALRAGSSGSSEN